MCVQGFISLMWRAQFAAIVDEGDGDDDDDDIIRFFFLRWVYVCLRCDICLPSVCTQDLLWSVEKHKLHLIVSDICNFSMMI